jgi:uroporphyrinogen-III synthase
MYFVITRPNPEAEILATKLPLKLLAICEPMIKVKYCNINCDHINGKLQETQGIIFTSANAVRSVSSMLQIYDFAVFTVGENTAKIAMQAGFNNVLCCGEDVDALCDYMISNRSRIGSSLIYFRGNHISQDLNAKLCAFGYKIDDLITYNTCAASCFSEDFLYKFHSGEIAAASFYSKETAKNYIKLACEHKLQDNHRQLEAFALSAQIADILLQIKWHRVSVAKKPTEASIVELINSYYG